MIKMIRKQYTDLSQDEIQKIEKINVEFGGLIFHETKFNQIVQETFNTELSYWIALSSTGTMIGFCPMHTEKRGFLKYSYSSPTHLSVPFGGWIFNSSMVTHDELIQGMKYGINESGIYFSSIQFPTDSFQQTKLPVKRLSTPIIDLSQTEEDIWNNSLKPSRRKRVRKSQKEGVVMKRYGAEGLEILLPCIKDLYQKINRPDKPDDYYRKVIDYYAPKNQACIIVAERDGEVLAGNIVIGNKFYMHLWAGAVRYNAPSIGLSEAIDWESIAWAKQNGFSYIDLCVIDEENLPQLAFYKLEITNHVVPFYHMVTSKLSFKIIAKLQKYLTPGK